MGYIGTMKIKPGKAVIADVDFGGMNPLDAVGGKLVTEILPDGTKAEFLVLRSGKKLKITGVKPADQ